MDNQLYISDLQKIKRLLRYEIARNIEDNNDNIANDDKKILAKIMTMETYVRDGSLKVNIVPNLN